MRIFVHTNEAKSDIGGPKFCLNSILECVQCYNLRNPSFFSP